MHTPLELSEEDWDQNLKTNLTGTWLVSKYVCMRMRDAKLGGSVINIASIAGLNRGQLPGGLVYAASKTAVNSITKVILDNPFDITIKLDAPLIDFSLSAIGPLGCVLLLASGKESQRFNKIDVLRSGCHTSYLC